MFRLPSSFSASRSHLWFRGILLAVITQISFAAAPPLSSATSAYLQALVDSPIAWHAWGDAAFAEAKQQGKPIFLSMGTATSELSRAMQRQSFSNAETAAFLNENFVCIAVDTKERADVFALYQNYLQTTKQVSGPPLNIWLTPELKPFEGANYLPPTEEWGKEGFITTMKRVANAWKSDPEAQRRKADEAVAAVKEAQNADTAAPISPTALPGLLATATETVRTRFDSTHGGFGEPPKYAEPELLRFLLRDPATRPMALDTLRAIIDSPLHDPLDGGFFRYVVDAEWRQPYFQKLLIDQPRLALALLEAAHVSGDARYADAARSALTFVLGTLQRPNGDYANAWDATAEEAMASQFWTVGEITDALGAAASEFCIAYGATPQGNLPEDAYPGLVTKGKNLLHRATPPGAASAEKKLEASRAKLLQRRQQRPAPTVDERATSGAHGLLLAALAKAGAQLNDPTLLAAAKAEAAFIRDHLRANDGGLLRLAQASTPAGPLDYAQVIEGLLTYATVANDQDAERLGRLLYDTLNARFRDPASNRYFTSSGDAPAAFWARVHSPAGGGGELSSVEAGVLSALSAHPPLPSNAEPLRSIVATELQNNPENPRGELLLALTPAP